MSEISKKWEIVSAKGIPLTVWLNPCRSDLEFMPELIRFTAYYRTQDFYAWDFRLGYHSDVSVALRLQDSFNSADFLKGHAKRNGKGSYEMVGSDFLQSFERKSTGADRALLIELLEKDWTWLSTFICEMKWLELFGQRFSISRSCNLGHGNQQL